jgi:hypothetical protein
MVQRPSYTACFHPRTHIQSRRRASWSAHTGIGVPVLAGFKVLIRAVETRGGLALMTAFQDAALEQFEQLHGGELLL